ncbi:hypothetical protein CTI12_AA159160 [Artemisia annua]|uniref:Uncharacterized protein n=1 Tax=Artemisia annua TaxID=35608 RepID=A0A2U1PFB5_ARTAN|nr:hypothetical protein CTI12_AA159160 [Artemisia annua]
MATNSHLTTLRKRFVTQIRTSSSSPLTLRRAVHVSSYDKNIDEQVRPTFVPEEAITRADSDTHWAPNPKTGVFGPAHEQTPGGPPGSDPATLDGSVLKEKAFYRPLENLEKPAHP